MPSYFPCHMCVYYLVHAIQGVPGLWFTLLLNAYSTGDTYSRHGYITNYHGYARTYHGFARVTMVVPSDAVDLPCITTGVPTPAIGVPRPAGGWHAPPYMCSDHHARPIGAQGRVRHHHSYAATHRP